MREYINNSKFGGVEINNFDVNMLLKTFLIKFLHRACEFRL